MRRILIFEGDIDSGLYNKKERKTRRGLRNKLMSCRVRDSFFQRLSPPHALH